MTEIHDEVPSTWNTDSAVGWLARDKAVLTSTLSRQHDVVVASGKGSWVTDVEGQRWLDLTSGIGVTNTGHCHPHVVEAITTQAALCLHTSVVAHQPPAVTAAERLVRHTPFFVEPQVFFCNTGAEAVDGAIKLARKVTHRPGILAFSRAFHGRTIGGTSLTTARSKYRDGYEPLLPSVEWAPYCHPLEFNRDEDRAVASCLSHLDQVFELRMPAHQMAAIMVEPVLGEGGYVAPPKAWLQGLRDRCTEHGILLIFDEVQCGMGRTGTMFAAEGYGVTPDVILFAKGVASGLPLGGLIAPRSIMQQWPPGSHGSTFGGNPVSCAAAIATIDVLEEGELSKSAGTRGAAVMQRLRTATTDLSGVVEVRGIGFMIGIEFVDAAAAARARAVCNAEHMLILTCGAGDNVLRLIPPLTISDDELEQALGILERAVLAA